ncbi:type IV toxin-antitoxin system AbiEi family antitoxin, partial [Flavobacterium sp.]|uniref:type IV toxin-antitoxin system AbiEi family antitoxin domain-containing protein n=1 Tax=Flavobacterium sp. TaxID=239 RepID=UPI002D1FA0C6
MRLYFLIEQETGPIPELLWSNYGLLYNHAEEWRSKRNSIKRLQKGPKSDTFRKNLLLKVINQHKSLEDWTNYLLAQGKHAFALHQLRIAFPEQSESANKSALKRLVNKEQIISIHKGYYLIIPPQYRSKGILPPTLFLDAFMKELDRPYYLALLNAAAYHGASHQQ